MLIRIILTALVFSLLFLIVDFNELVETFSSLRLSYVAGLFLISLVMIWLSALKWQVFINAAGHSVGILRLMRLYTVGYFFNTFTPSYIGGDIARSYQLGRFLGNQERAFVATFLERFTGLLAMSSLGVFFVLLGTSATAGVEIAVLLVGLGALTLAILFFSPRSASWFESFSLKLIGRFAPEKLGSKLSGFARKVFAAMESARGDHRVFIKAMLLSLVFHFFTVVNTYVAAKAVGWDSPDFLGLFIVVPLVLLVGMVPLTPSGLGIQEGAFLFFLQRLGASEAQGLSVGLVLRAKVMVVALLGGLLWLAVRKDDSKNHSAGDEDGKIDETVRPVAPVL